MCLLFLYGTLINIYLSNRTSDVKGSLQWSWVLGGSTGES